MDLLVYDLEIKKMIPSPDFAREPDLEYCGGWGDRANMGISVITAYDYREQTYRIFLEDNFDEFMRLCERRKMIASWNGRIFDDKVVAATLGELPMKLAMRYDLLVELREAGARIGHGGSLDAWSFRNTRVGKTGNGALAPALWQRGQHGRVIDYCLNDTRMLKGLIDLVIDNEPLICPKTGLFMRPISPQAILAEAALEAGS